MKNTTYEAKCLGSKNFMEQQLLKALSHKKYVQRQS